MLSCPSVKRNGINTMVSPTTDYHKCRLTADDKVSTVNSYVSPIDPIIADTLREKILAMDGGGQDSIAYILLYR